MHNIIDINTAETSRRLHRLATSHFLAAERLPTGLWVLRELDRHDQPAAVFHGPAGLRGASARTRRCPYQSA